MMPKETNANGTIFGGLILSQIDLAGAIEARRYAAGKLVTVAMREVVFVAPVYVGDLVSYYTETVRCGRTSVTVKVRVEAERQHVGPSRDDDGQEAADRRGSGDDADRVAVTTAEVVYVHIDGDGKPIPIDCCGD